MELIFIAAVLGYVALHLYINTGLSRSISLDDSAVSKLPAVTIIVAARNEEERIAKCISSLAEIDYPENLLEVFLVNDRSDDKTFEIMKSSTEAISRFKVINSRPIEQSNLKGKANAIDTAIEHCNGEIVITTDADCIVPPTWVKTTVCYFHSITAMVCGYTLISHCNSLFAKLQCLDWLYLLSLASGSCGMRKTMSCVGNNLAFTKDSYINAGGYSAITFSVTEDLALMRMIQKQGVNKVIYPINNDALVITEPCKNISELASQKRRWFRGGTGINPLGYITGILLYTAAILILFGWMFLSLKIWLLLSSIVVLTQVYIMSRPAIRLQHTGLLAYAPLFTLYISLYGFLLPFSFILGKGINWKGRKF